MEEFLSGPEPGTKPVRPTLLTVLCILTFVGSGMNLISSFFIAGFYEEYLQVLQVFADKFKLPGLEEMADAKPIFFLVSGLLYAGSLAGAILMFRLKKAGFHVYTISQILLILAPMYFMHLPAPDMVSVLFSALFIILYTRSLKELH